MTQDLALALSLLSKVADEHKATLEGKIAKTGGILRLTASWEGSRTEDSPDAILPWSTPWRAIALEALARLNPTTADAAIVAACTPLEIEREPSEGIAKRLEERREALQTRGMRKGAVRGNCTMLQAYLEPAGGAS